MKKLLLTILVMSTSICLLAQKSEVINLDSSLTKADLFSKSLTWVAKTWKEANEVVQMKDQESGVIVVKGGLASKPKSLGMPTKGMTHTTLTIRVKDGKAKLEFEGTYFDYYSGTVKYDSGAADTGIYKKWKVAVEEEMAGMIADYKEAISKKAADF